MDALNDGAVAEVAWEVEVLPPPLVGLRLPAGCVELPHVLPIFGGTGSEVLGLGLTEVPLVEIPVREVVLFKEVVVEFLRGEIKPPEIALELAGGTFFR